MNVEKASLESFDEFREVGMRLQGAQSQQEKTKTEHMRINARWRYEQHTPETKAALNRAEAQKDSIDREVADLEANLATIRLIRSREICRGLQSEYAGIVQRLASALDEFSAVLNEERIFRELLQEKGIEITWPPPVQLLDAGTLVSFQGWMAEVMVETLEKNEATKQTKKGR